jgi:hypothetical protein
MSEYKRKTASYGVLAIMLVALLGLASNFLYSELSPQSQKEGKTQPGTPQEDIIVYFLPQGAIMARLNVTELAQGAETIIIGDVTEILSSQKDPETGVIYTDVVLDVETCMKISLNHSTILVRALGGTFGNLGMGGEDGTSFTEGERVLLFLGRIELYGNSLHVVGGHQGKYVLQNGMAINKDPSRNATLEALLKEIEEAI